MKYKAIAALLLTTAIWGIAGPVIKYTLGYIPPFTFLTLRLFIASLIVIPIIIVHGGITILKRENLKHLVLLSLLGQPLSLGLIFLGYKYTSSLEGTIIGTTFPIFLSLAGLLFLKEKVTKKEQIGIIITLVGTFLIIFVEPLLQGNLVAMTSIKGNLLIFLGNLSWLGFVILEKKRFGKKRKYNFEGMAFSFIIAFFALIPLALFEIFYLKIDILPYIFEPKALTGLLYMGILSSVVAYIAYDYGLSKVEASETGIYSYLQPLFALPAAYFLLSEIPTIYMIPGLICIGAGFFLSESGSSHV